MRRRRRADEKGDFFYPVGNSLFFSSALASLRHLLIFVDVEYRILNCFCRRVHTRNVSCSPRAKASKCKKYF